MKENDQSSLDSAKLAIHATKKVFRKMKQAKPNDLDQKFHKAHEAEFKKMDCLSCANCCKTMTPTFTPTDIKRISAHLNTTPKEFKEKWLHYDKKDNDWLNKLNPCQFLNLKTHKCDIYDVRPADCAGFPHLTKKKLPDYVHVHKQNVELCPATYKMVEKMQALLQ